MPRSNDSIDLHTHTTYSDGVLTPRAILEEAQWRGVSAVAITDHDTIDGIEEAFAAGEEMGIEVVAGVELSCRFRHLEAHIVGLLITPDAEFLSLLAHLRACRETRMDQMIEKLADLGIRLNRADLPIESNSHRALGRPHLARALVAKNFVSHIGEAFDKYIGDYGPAYVEREYLAPEQAIDAIRRMGGISILAHPSASGLVGYLDDFREIGIQGVEVHYPQHSPLLTEKLLAYCAAHQLLPSSGSDFHHGHERMSCIGTPFVPYRLLSAMHKRCREFTAQVS